MYAVAARVAFCAKHMVEPEYKTGTGGHRRETFRCCESANPDLDFNPSIAVFDKAARPAAAPIATASATVPVTGVNPET